MMKSSTFAHTFYHVMFCCFVTSNETVLRNFLALVYSGLEGLVHCSLPLSRFSITLDRRMFRSLI